MKKIVFVLLLPLLFFSTLQSCNDDETDEPEVSEVNYKQEMRGFVQGISSYAKSFKSEFFVIPQNGVELVSTTGDYTGNPATDYLTAIDGIGQEDLFFGYDNDDEPTPFEATDHLMYFLDLAKGNGIKILVTDYCSTHSKMDESYDKSEIKNYVSFAADHRELDDIPDYPASPFNVNNDIVTNLNQIKNFLYLINPSDFNSKQEFIDSVRASDYDLLIMDCFFNDEEFTIDEIAQLKEKSNGGKRLVISYMSIGEAEEYRYYWNDSWNTNPPDWLAAENPEWQGNFKVKYWYGDWQSIIYGNNNSYLKKILDAGFDGVYLDIIDAFEYFDEK